MSNLDISYLGLEMKTPVIVSSSGLTDSPEKIKKLEKLGAGAVVLKSLFEEQINYEAGYLLEYSDYPEAEDYIRNYTKSNSLEEYLNLIQESKKSAGIPVIASINCVTASDWISFSKKIEDAGADALELNVYVMPVDKETKPSEYDTIYSKLAEKIKEVITIPVSMKLGNQFTNILYIINQLYMRRIEGVVLFNRFYTPDIDTAKMKLISSDLFSSPADIRHTLRWIGIVSGNIENIDLAASTGVHDGNAVVKLILAGANAVQVCSSLYKNGPDYLEHIITGIEKWMKRNNYRRIEEFRGKLNYSNLPDPAVYERSQFMKYFSNYHG